MERKIPPEFSYYSGLRLCSLKLLLLSLLLTLSQLLLSPFLSLLTKTSTGVGESHAPQLKVYVANLPTEFNLGLLESYWSSQNKSGRRDYPESPLFKQHSAEFWLLKDLLAAQKPDRSSPVVRVSDSLQADVVFVPFFAALSAQMQLRSPGQRGVFRRRVEENFDFVRQRRVVQLVKESPEWRRTNGMDHVFVLADPMAMWHVRDEVSSAIFLVVDFGGWYQDDAKNKLVNSSVIQHAQVSPIKDVIVPHTHLLPTLTSSETPHQPRTTLLYFRGARHRHRNGLVREKLWTVLEHQPGVALEEGLPDEEGLQLATRGMRSSEFCLSPAGDTPSSARLYDAIASLCIPVIVSDDILLPFEGVVRYEDFCVFASSRDAVRPGWLLQKLRSIGRGERELMRQKMAEVQRYFEYGTGDGAVSLTWRKVQSKVPVIQESVARYRRRNRSSSPVWNTRCHCVS